MPRIADQRPEDFVDLDSAGLVLDLKYRGHDNFTGSPVPGYGPATTCLTGPAAEALARVQERAAGQGLQIRVFDAYRPQRAVQRFIDWSREPDIAAQKARYYPGIAKRDLFARGYLSIHSAHSRGSTLDLSLADAGNGGLLDMGTEFDFFGPRSHTVAEGLSAIQRANRQRLLDLMQAGGFENYWMEWWHFTLRDEPYPDTYFDFPMA